MWKHWFFFCYSKRHHFSSYDAFCFFLSPESFDLAYAPLRMHTWNGHPQGVIYLACCTVNVSLCSESFLPPLFPWNCTCCTYGLICMNSLLWVMQVWSDKVITTGFLVSTWLLFIRHTSISSFFLGSQWQKILPTSFWLKLNKANSYVVKEMWF